MSILDTTAYFRSVYTQGYVPFENNSYNKYNERNEYNGNGHGWNNFCPKCHCNYNSHYHKTRCTNQLPLGDGIIPLLSILLIYYLSKNYKSWKR